jgi:hypothetical protein
MGIHVLSHKQQCGEEVGWLIWQGLDRFSAAVLYGSRRQVSRRFGGRGMVWVRESQVGVGSAKAKNAMRSKVGRIPKSKLMRFRTKKFDHTM